ncbi:YifB family Mg chelatase-like AAA ATPase [uncultured Alistipes sp.]|uniref:YifB family Mg chelatase-like AAA ATPase n=1 Tax=uncultured Alistipes sp. TaxID=538949 RepID=UPI002617FE04|nr:YifB family Mg chelatase-like AAA ATPase [uncultured Alistipes sp.]
MFVRTFAGALLGIDAVKVTVEVDITGGGLGLYLVGLPDNAVKESEQRIRAAFGNSGERMSGRKVVVNLAPADLRKEGAGFDLPIAVGILAAMGRIDAGAVGDTMFVGELSLDGSLRAVRGMLPLALAARREGLRRVVLPAENAAEAAVVTGIEIVGAGTLREVVEYLNGERTIAPTLPSDADPFDPSRLHYAEDFADVKGQTHVKRALEIAAAGGHNVLMIGAPGSGKTMLARRLPTILPPLTREEALETTKIHSVAGKTEFAGGLMTLRPFRAPHHLTSQVALIGGGQSPRPGEVSLAHNGVLFLDELPEFGRSVLEVLRQPLEEKRIVVSRAKYSVEYPANFTLVAAMNPCPCGYYNHPTKECTCSPGSVHRYMGRISGPLLDRIDLQVEVIPVEPAELTSAAPGEPSSAIRERVIRAREVQAERFRGVEGVHTNSMMGSSLLRSCCRLDADSSALLTRAMERLSLSARAYDRILKVARTIADLAGRAEIAAADVAEAIGYRSLDRGTWGR